MESLLSLSFDYLTTANSDKIRKGLKQLEGLLAQICLSKGESSNARGHAKRHSVAVIPSQPAAKTPPRELSQLKDDPAFREFFKLQDGFEYNVAMRLIGCLEKLLGKSENIDLLAAQTLSLLYGVLLLHPPSRTLFARETNMNLLLDLLYPSSAFCPAVQVQTILVLVTALLDNPACTRSFEDQDGLLTITTVSKDPESSKEVKMKCMSFLYFYLMPETPWGWTTSEEETQVWDEEKAGSATRSMRDKQRMLASYMSNVDTLVDDLMQSQHFGGILPT